MIVEFERSDLNQLRFARQRLYYTPPGLAMATLYADLVLEASNGEVQLVLKEEYLPGERGWPRVYASASCPVRTYRSLAKQTRQDVAVMLKIGTYDDSVASHFVVVDPKNPGRTAENDVPILDPAQPIASTKRPWRLSDSSARVRGDPEIDKEWRKHRIGNLQLGGVWVFARWASAGQRLLGQSFIATLSSLARSGTGIQDVKRTKS